MKLKVAMVASVLAGALVTWAGAVWSQNRSDVGSAATMPGEFSGWAAGYAKEVAGVKPILMPLWEGEAPNQVAATRPERNDGERVWEVNAPGMLVYLPDAEKLKATGGACIVYCPGGSYTHLTRLVGADHTVEAFVPKGIAVVSLKYRLTPPSKDPERDAVIDGRRALRLVRLHAAEWGIDPKKVGMMGASAGGNLILSLCTHEEGDEGKEAHPLDKAALENGRPDFVVMWSPWPNKRTLEAYAPASGLALPPAMIGGAKDDKTAPFVFVSGVRDAWEKAGGKVEFIPAEKGGHGAFELGVGTAGDWAGKVLEWMKVNGFWKE
jgi:acetyl esterase/lipase